VRAEPFDTLVVDFGPADRCDGDHQGAARDLRLEYELEMNQLNRQQAPDIESVYIMGEPGVQLRVLQRCEGARTFGGNIEGLVHADVARRLQEELSRRRKS